MNKKDKTPDKKAIEDAIKSMEVSESMEDDMLTSEEAMAKIGMRLADTPDPQLLTEINRVEVTLLASVKSVADELEAPLVQSLVNNFTRFRVSLERKGRGELVNLVRSTKEEMDAKNKLKKMLLLGRG